MNFKEFAQKLFSVLSGGASTDRFTRSLFSSILCDSGQDILDNYQPSSYKGFYNGNTSITRISKKINAYIDPMLFSVYINDFPDASRELLCDIFKGEFPDIESYNVGDKLAELFASIITEAAGTPKRSSLNNSSKLESLSPLTVNDETIHPFKNYLDASVSYYSTKKTLLYAEKPHPFYDLYVCNDVRYKKTRFTGFRDTKPEKTISNATIKKLEAESKYIIIAGIGGIGKSMLLTHLFLSAAKETCTTGTIPLFLSLKNYKDTTNNIVDFIWNSVKEFDSNIKQKDIINALLKKKLILLLDGLDEIQSSARDSFHMDLEAFIKSYQGNTIIITSRPIYSFVSYSKFSIFDIQALTKPQALELIQKLEFWDEVAKENFLTALNRHLFASHYQFASNPLLLTIMLMTYTSFGEVPAKMHVFYSKAYETMARLHDASKGSFKRPLHTQLTPEEFAKYFSEFCARTYKDEILEFDSLTFTAYMEKVLKDSYAERKGVTPRDFLLDLTDNLCIMYREGEKYYFIHRSFQEYFAAVHFASGYDAKLNKVGNFFEKMQHRSYTDRTFDMLYDMIPEKVERFIFLPFLETLITECSQKGSDEEYWEFLEHQYPAIYYQEGDTGETYFNEAQSFLYQSIISELGFAANLDLDGCSWPEQIYDLPTRVWVKAYREFLDYDAYEKYPNPEKIDEKVLEFVDLIPEDDLPYEYSKYFGTPDKEGLSIEIEIYELRKRPDKYGIIRAFMEQADFPLMQEYQNVKEYYRELKLRTEKENESDDLFDD